MKPTNESGRPGGNWSTAEDKAKGSREKFSTLGRYPWRKDRGLLTIGDHVRRYLAVRHPSGPYFISMPEDLLGREVRP